MINLPPADWKHIQAQIAAASKQSMHAGTHYRVFEHNIDIIQFWLFFKRVHLYSTFFKINLKARYILRFEKMRKLSVTKTPLMLFCILYSCVYRMYFICCDRKDILSPCHASNVVRKSGSLHQVLDCRTTAL